MENDNELDLNLDELESNAEKKLEVKNRYQKLSEKVKTEAQAREEAEAKTKVAEEGKLVADKRADFFKNFSQVSSKYPNATEYQEQILERVNKGIDLEEATVGVLHKEGKFQASVLEPSRPDNIAGGSASTVITDTGDKRVEEMTHEEKRSALLQMEKEGTNLLRL